MATIAQIFGHRPMTLDKPSKDLVLNVGIGIEVELEDVPQLDIPLWNCIEDGSLRNGREFVCSRPYSGIQLKKAIINFSNAMEAARPNGSWRCSAHVHMDVRDIEVDVLKKVILAYAFYEHVLYGCSGEHRYHSNFAPAMNAVQDQLVQLAEHWSLPDELFVRHIATVWDKYSSLNLKPMQRYGSIELRISEPKWMKENLMLLVNRFQTLMSLAKDSPAEETMEAFVDKLWELGIQPMRDYLVHDYMFEQSHLEEGYVNAHDILAMRSTGSAVFDVISENNPSVVDEGDHTVQVPSLRHWQNILHYVQSHERNGADPRRNAATRNIRDWAEFDDIMERFTESARSENDGFILLSTFRRICDYFAEHGDGALTGAFQTVVRDFDNANTAF